MTSPARSVSAASLRGLSCHVVLAGDADYDAVRGAWSSAHDQRPFAVALPESAADVVEVVRAAAASGLRVAPQATGHGAGALADTDLADVVLVSLSRMRGVEVDPEARTARVLGGTQWKQVLAATAPHGLTAVHGSSGEVGVVGYALNGGISVYGRQHGLGVNSVRAVTLVTADGRLVRADATADPELFWAVRGGSGAFGVVVEVEIDLLPYPDVFAGMLVWDASRAAEVMRAWADWTRTVPESVTTAVRVLNLPVFDDLPVPELLPYLSGASVVAIDGAILESDEVAERILAPLRALAPVADTFRRIPAGDMGDVHLDPSDPSPVVSAHATLEALPPEVTDALAEVGTTLRLSVTELRHLGGAIARRPEGAGSVAAIDAEYMVVAIDELSGPDDAERARAAIAAVMAAAEPWSGPPTVLTFIDVGGVDRAPGFGEAHERLLALKDAHDPAGVLVAAQRLR